MEQYIILSTDGPISTLQQAVDRSRETGCKHILVRPGIYYASAVVLDERDCGLILESDGTGTATFSGSVAIDGFERDADTGFLYRQLDESFSTDFRMICANGRYLNKARFPKTGTLTHKNEWDVPWMSTFGNGWKRKPTHEELTTLIYTPEEIPADFRYKNAEIIVYHDWDESFVGIDGMDKESNTFTLSSECGHPPAAFFHHEYTVFNTVEGMTEPLDWYLDKEQRKIFIFPDEEMLSKPLTVTVPMTYSIIKMDGCKDITVKGLQFTGCTSALGAAEFGAQRVAGAIDGFDVDNVTIDGITVANSGGMGVRFTGTNITVKNSQFNTLGAGGIWIGINDEYLYTPYEEQEQGCSSLVENCTVHHTGIDYYASIGLYTRHTRVIGNRVDHTPYSGISVGGDNVVVEGNIVSDTMRKLNDGAAIYTIGYKNGVMRNNMVFGLTPDPMRSPKLAFYLDEHTRDWIVENNYIKDCPKPFNHHINGTGVIVRNNVIDNANTSVECPCVRSENVSFIGNMFTCKGNLQINATKGMSHTFKDNIVRITDGELMWQEYVDYTPDELYAFTVDDSNTILKITTE
ncbi:MAG: right-handed parallel beta-helix repeat-containing protein [Clostridia bacterium]|nr:right-handed parallel beta-helix repeat-containing protein [Clostridia bacterium]